MKRSLFVVEDRYGAVLFSHRERPVAELQQRVRHVPSAIVEYVPRVRCDGCKHGSDWKPTNTGWDKILCAKDGDIHLHGWYCADHEAKEET